MRSNANYEEYESWLQSVEAALDTNNITEAKRCAREAIKLRRKEALSPKPLSKAFSKKIWKVLESNGVRRQTEAETNKLFGTTPDIKDID